MKALVVDDDLVLADVISFTLRRAGFEVILAHDGRKALERWRAESPNIVILDIQIPYIDGLEVCRQIRALSSVPIIFLSVREGDENVVRGLEIGADDYITKPFSPVQLLARVNALLRRTGEIPAPKRLTFADVTLNVERHQIERPERPPVQLTQLEYRLLETLMLNREQVLTAEMLIDRTWGPDGGDKAMLKQLIYRLRRKLDESPDSPIYIEAVPGIGYALMNRFSGDS